MGEGTVEALREIDIDIPRGEFLAVMGSSGSGKSTFLNIIGLLDHPDKGIYLLEDREVGTLDDRMRSKARNELIGFVFQSFNLLPRATALRNVMLPLAYQRLREQDRLNLARHALDSVGLSHRVHHLPTQLSGGECQRVALARALVGNPSVLLADEPTGNLDSKTGEEILQLLKDLEKQGQTVIMVTHDPIIAKYANRVIKMLDGMIIESWYN